MKKFLIWALIIVGVMIGVVGAGVQFAASRLVDSGLEMATLQLPESITLDYADSDVSLLSRKASLKQVNLTLSDENLNVKVGELTVDELQQTDNEDIPIMINGIQMSDVDITPLDTGATVHINEIVLRDVGDVMAQQIVSGGSEEFTIPPSLDIELIGVQITADMLADQDIDLSSFGYELPMDADVSVKYTFSDSDKDFQLDTMRIASDDVFVFDVSTHLGGIDMDVINALQDETTSDPLTLFLTFAENLRLYDLNFTYTDDSFADRALTQMAEEQGMSLDAFKADMIASIDEMSAAETDPKSTEATQAFRDFINDPAELTVGINPETPLTAEDFFSFMLSSQLGGGIDAESLAERMNITVSSR